MITVKRFLCAKIVKIDIRIGYKQIFVLYVVCVRKKIAGKKFFLLILLF